MYIAVLCSIFKFDHLSPYSLIDHLDFKLSTKLNFPALFYVKAIWRIISVHRA